MSVSAAHVTAILASWAKHERQLGNADLWPPFYKAEILTTNLRLCICCILLCIFLCTLFELSKIHILNAQRRSNCFYISSSKSTWLDPMIARMNVVLCTSCCWLYVKKQKRWFTLIQHELLISCFAKLPDFDQVILTPSIIIAQPHPSPSSPASCFSLSLLFLWTMFCTLVNSNLNHSLHSY